MEAILDTKKMSVMYVRPKFRKCTTNIFDKRTVCEERNER